MQIAREWMDDIKRQIKALAYLFGSFFLLSLPFNTLNAASYYYSQSANDSKRSGKTNSLNGSKLSSHKTDQASKAGSKTAKSKDSDEEPPKIGNFSLPVSQQPGSLIALGEIIFDKGTLQLPTNADYFKGGGRYSTDVIASLLYCPTDKSSLVLTVPYAARYKNDGDHSSGIEDIFLQFEHAIYSKDTRCHSDLFTLFVNASLPTGSATKTPPTGFGAPTFLLGTAFLRLYVDWLFFASHAALTTTSHHGTKFGNQIFYQYGLGKNIAYETDKWIFDWILELSGQFLGRDRIMGERDPNSGGNIILLTPSLWFSTKHTIFQFGIGKPVVQHLFGAQRKLHYALFGTFTWTF